MGSRSARFVLLAGLLASGPAVAQGDQSGQNVESGSIESIHAALETGNAGLAVQRADQRLAEHDNEAQTRFLKASALAATGANAAALSIVSRLRAEYPERADIANNLGVLLARTGQLAEARAALEDASTLAPDDTAIKRNLGDVYLALAQRAYTAAGSEGAERRARLGDMLPALDDVGRTAVEGPAVSRPQAAIADVLRDRAAARANRDFQAWLASYSDDFTPANGQSRAEWLSAARATFDAPGQPAGPIRDIQVAIDAPDRARGTYRQPDDAGGVARRAASFVQEDGQWRIVSQRASALGLETR